MVFITCSYNLYIIIKLLFQLVNKGSGIIRLSGLALADANQGLAGITDDKGEDGLLYAIEVTGLNLQGTELVSLSACDTGKGVVDYSEGVYGLVRAFRTAGAQNVLMRLSPVGDEASREDSMSFCCLRISRLLRQCTKPGCILSKKIASLNSGVRMCWWGN